MVKWKYRGLMYYSEDTTESIYTVIKKFIYSATGYNVYTERTNFIKPDGNYATVFIESYQSTGDNKGDTAGYDSDGNIIRFKNYNVTVTTRFYRDGAFNQMLSLHNYFASPTEFSDLPLFEEDFIALLRMNLISNVSVPIDDSNWEERAQCLMTFNTSIAWTEDVGEISEITITTTTNGGNGDITGSTEIDSDGTTVINTDSDGD